MIGSIAPMIRANWYSLVLGAAMLLIAMIPSVARADDQCHLKMLAKLNMSTETDGHVDVPMSIDGKTVNLLIATNGFMSSLTRSSVDLLGVRTRAAGRVIGRAYGGEDIDDYVIVRNILFDRLKADEMRFLVTPDFGETSDIGGILGADVMRHYDVEFDFANAVFNLFSPDHCEGQVVYWTRSPYGNVDFKLGQDGKIDLPVLLDGKEIRATIATGSWRTTASLEGIENSFDIEKSPDLKAATNAFYAGSRSYPFKTLTFNDVTVNNPDIVLVPDDTSKIGSSLPTISLGMNVLRRLHLYIAYREHTVYVTPATAH